MFYFPPDRWLSRKQLGVDIWQFTAWDPHTFPTLSEGFSPCPKWWYVCVVKHGLLMQRGYGKVDSCAYNRDGGCHQLQYIYSMLLPSKPSIGMKREYWWKQLIVLINIFASKTYSFYCPCKRLNVFSYIKPDMILHVEFLGVKKWFNIIYKMLDGYLLVPKSSDMKKNRNMKLTYDVVCELDNIMWARKMLRKKF